MDNFFDHYQAGDSNNWTGRIDEKTDRRWHQWVQTVDLKKADAHQMEGHFVLLGFACDEGIRRNQGRIGAKAGPEHLRKALSGFSWNWGETYQLFDAGDVVCPEKSLEGAQDGLSTAIKLIFGHRGIPLVLGGGHETAYGSYMGLRQAFEEQYQIGIINIDAHFDLRSPAMGASSGTPFRQIADYCDKHQQTFNYFCLGINPAGNTKSLFQTALDHEVAYLTIDELFYLPMHHCLEKLEVFMEQVDLIYLSIDLDAFDGAYAPGVSAPAATGLSPSLIIPFINAVIHSNKLALADVCELNPTYDQDGRTAKLGAGLLFRIVDGIIQGK